MAHASVKYWVFSILFLPNIFPTVICFSAPRIGFLVQRQHQHLHLHQQHHQLRSTKNDDGSIESLKTTIEKAIIPTKRGVSATEQQKAEIDSLILELESQCPLEAPARDPRMEGKWRVEYTTAPPPSNGQLGPFTGIARQVIDLDGGNYVNLLQVEPNQWLAAELRAKWFDWDGTYLEDGENPIDDSQNNDKEEETVIESTNASYETGNVFSSFKSFVSSLNSSPTKSSKSKAVDYGATSWKVDFESLSIKLFGVPIVTKQFENTSRVWRMSYLDDDVRIVRAGRTGKSKDDVVFYMTKESEAN